MPACATWATAGVLWFKDNALWSECAATPPTPSSELGIQPLGVDATTLAQPWLIEPWNPYRAGEIKKPKVIELIFKMMGDEYKEKKEIKKIDIDVENVNLKVNPKNIDLKLKD